MEIDVIMAVLDNTFETVEHKPYCSLERIDT